MRRIRHTLTSASSSTSLRLWALGGQKNDGSGTVLNELWQYAAPKSTPLQGTWSQCSVAPTASFDHASVAILDSSNQLVIYAMGGVGPNDQALDMSNLYRFTPDLSSVTCSGRWETLSIHGTSVPSPRRGHSIVSLSPTQILLYGGASANGQRVDSDLWLLDLSAMSWSQLDHGDSHSPGARWGHTMVRVGTKVVVAFGYGSLDTSQPAPSSVGVYDLQQLKWSDSYSPSLTPDGRSSSAILQVSDPADLNLHDPDAWNVPGSKGTVKPLPIPPPGGKPSGPSITTSTILGITLGIFGALMMGLGSVLAYRYQKKVKEERVIAADAYKQKAYGPDFGDGDMQDDDKVRLVDQTESLHASYTIPRARTSVARRLETTVPGPLKALAGVGVGVRALWPQKRYDKRKERFDILADEESDVWVCTDAASMSSAPASSGYIHDRPLKKYDECCTERVRLPPPPPCPMSEVQRHLPSLVTTRGGLRIWDGIDEPIESQCGFGTSTSFLGASLAPWSDDGRGTSLVSECGRYEALRMDGQGSSSSHLQQASGETLLGHDPFADPQEDDAGDRHTREGTGYSTIDVADSSRASNTTYVAVDGYNHDEVEALDNWGGLSAAGLSNLSLISAAGNPFLSPKSLERGGTWWDRLRYGTDKHAVVDLSPGAIQPIRDPTPAPAMLPIEPSDDGHPAKQKTSELGGEYRIDEHGRCRTGTDGSICKEDAGLTHTSQASNQTASTATSSMIEAATAHMTVVQRLRRIDSSGMSESSSLPNSLQSVIQMQIVESLELTTPLLGERPLSPRPKGPRVHSPTLSPPPHVSLLPIVLASVEQPMVERPPTKRTETAGSLGVKAMVKQFEAPLLPPAPALDRPTCKPPRAVTHHRVKVERSLVKKPLLFVANPDK